MNAVFVILAPIVIAVFALTMERFEAMVVGTGPTDSEKGRRAEAQKAAAAAAEAQAVAEGKGAGAVAGKNAADGAGPAKGSTLPETGTEQPRPGGDGTGHEPGLPAAGTERRT